jgi:ribonuclease III
MEEEWETKVKFWMKKYQIQTINLNLIREALTHSSFKGMGFEVKDNERLEFLGDSVLDLIVAHQLFLNSQLSEGIMTEKRKKLVNNEELALLFDRLEVRALTRTANDFELSIKNKADFIEALFGAIFLDKGYMRCVEFWEIIKNSKKLIESREKKPTENVPINIQSIPKRHINAKNALQEYCQKLGDSLPTYKVVSKEGLEHKPLFTVEASVKTSLEDIISSASALTKKNAEILAAEKICDKLEIEYHSIYS